MQTLAQPNTLPPVVASPAAAQMEEITRLRQRREEVERQMDVADYGATGGNGRSLRLERRAINEQLEALTTLGDGGPLLTVTLDTFASSLVRRSMAVHHTSSAADVVNGALSFTCGEEDDHDWPEEMHKAAARRVERHEQSDAAPIAGEPREMNARRVHLITVELTPVQLRMLMQIADVQGEESMAEIITRQLGEYVAHMLECFHGHNMEAVRERWNREGGAL